MFFIVWKQTKKQKKTKWKHNKDNKNKAKNKTTEENAKNKSNLGFKKGMLGSVFQRKKQKGVDGQKAKKKLEFWKGRQKENKERKQKRKKIDILKQASWGNKIDKKTLKLQENRYFGPFYQTKHKNTSNKKQNHPKKKTTKPPIVGKLFFFVKFHSFMIAKLCFAENTLRLVLSAGHSFCVSQIVKPRFEGNPYFCSVWWLWMGTKKGPFSQNR